MEANEPPTEIIEKPSPDTDLEDRLPEWKCMTCGGSETWFDRTIEVNPDGTERGMATRCVGCGRDVAEPNT